MARELAVAGSVMFALVACPLGIFFIVHGIQLIRKGDAKLVKMKAYFDERGHDPLGFQILRFCYIGRFFLGGVVGIFGSIQMVVLAFTMDLAW